MNRPTLAYDDSADLLLHLLHLAGERDRLRDALAAVRRQAVNGLGAVGPPATAQWLNLIRDTADAALQSR